MKSRIRDFFADPTRKLRLVDILIAALAAVPSAISMTVLLFLRQPYWKLEEYYQDPTRDFLKDLFNEFVPRVSVIAVYFGILIVYLLLRKIVRKRSIASLVVAVIISFYIITSYSMELGGMTDIQLPIGVFWNSVVLIGNVCFVSRTIDFFYYLLGSASLKAKGIGRNLDEKRGKTMMISFLCLWICWLPGLILCHPGGANPDTLQQVESWLGRYRIEASNPLLATALYGISYSIGSALSGDNAGWFLALLMQATVCSLAITYCADYIRQITGSKRWQIVTILYFALVPTWQNAMVQLLKDVLHTGYFLLFYVLYLKALEEDGSGKRVFLYLCISVFAISYTRKAAFYIALLALIAVVIVQRKRELKKALACLLCAVICFYAPSILIYPMLNIEPEREEENYSMQFQQVAYYCKTYQNEMTQEEIDIINSTLSFDAAVNDFTPTISDPVKMTYHGTAEDHAAFWKLYKQMFKRHPLTMLYATYICTFRHLDPWYLYRFEYGISRKSNINIYHTNPNIDAMGKYWESWRNVPLVRMILVTGLSTWLVMALVGYAVKKKNGKIFIGLLPAFVLFVGLFMSHVNGMLRYGYPLIAVCPLLIAWTVHAGKVPARCAVSEGASVSVEDFGTGSGRRKFRNLLNEKPDLNGFRLSFHFLLSMDDVFVRRLCNGQLRAAKRTLALYKAGVFVGELFRKESKTESSLAKAREMEKQLSKAKDALDLSEQIGMYLDLWKSTRDVPKKHLLNAIQTGCILLEEAEQYKQLMPDDRILTTEPLTRKIAELREAYGESIDPGNDHV